MAAYQVGHHIAMRAALLPRPFRRENSARKAIATGKSMPTPKPMTKRAPPSTQALGASPHAMAATTKKNMSAMKTRYRPILSVRYPPRNAPMIAPNVIAEATKPVAAGVLYAERKRAKIIGVEEHAPERDGNDDPRVAADCGATVDELRDIGRAADDGARVGGLGRKGNRHGTGCNDRGCGTRDPTGVRVSSQIHFCYLSNDG